MDADQESKTLIVIGKGSHTLVVRSIAIARSWTVQQLSSEDFAALLSTDSAKQDKIRAICAIGDNERRRQVIALANNSTKKHLEWITLVHPAATVDATAHLGQGVCVCAGAVVQPGARIGDHCIINTLCSVDHDSAVGDFVHIAPHAAVCGSCVIGEGCLVGASSCVLPTVAVAPWTLCKAQQLVKQSSSPVPMYIPSLPPQYLADLQIAIQAGAISSQARHGSYGPKTEQMLRELLSVQHALLVNNGTSATHCLFLALKFKYPLLRKIYVPNNVYVAVWNTALYEYEPSQLEVLPTDPRTWTMPCDQQTLDSLEQDSALVVVHNVGNVVNVPFIRRRRPDLVIVEDNCEALMGKYGYDDESKQGQQVPTGSACFCASLSFFANKTVTSGEGGAFVTNDTATYDYIRRVYNQGMTSRRYVHDVLGYNYRMTNLQAALLYPQLQDLTSLLQRKKRLFDLYRSTLQSLGCRRIVFAESDPHTVPACWMFALRITGSKYDETEQFMTVRKQVEVRPLFYPISVHRHLSAVPQREDRYASLLSQETFMIPSYPDLDDVQALYICRCISQYCDELDRCDRDQTSAPAT